ncbi:MAG: CopG family transcriptional regulator / antitoxin EndoAI [Acidobacteriota bacterium]|nr:CopG family transcriptional regulator / antitoxin EndoAI [Acidobacteriota bacterium]
MTHLDISLPDEIAKKLVLIPNKNRFIAKAIKEQFELERRKGLERLLIEGYKATNLEEKAVNAEWERASLEKCNQIRTIDKQRLIKALGKIRPEIIEAVEEATKIHLEMK